MQSLNMYSEFSYLNQYKKLYISFFKVYILQSVHMVPDLLILACKAKMIHVR